MWLLIMILLNDVPGSSQVTVLQTYATLEECQTARSHVTSELAAAYPYERDFVIACRINPRRSA